MNYNPMYIKTKQMEHAFEIDYLQDYTKLKMILHENQLPCIFFNIHMLKIIYD